MNRRPYTLCALRRWQPLDAPYPQEDEIDRRFWTKIGARWWIANHPGIRYGTLWKRDVVAMTLHDRRGTAA